MNNQAHTIDLEELTTVTGGSALPRRPCDPLPPCGWPCDWNPKFPDDLLERLKDRKQPR